MWQLFSQHSHVQLPSIIILVHIMAVGSYKILFKFNAELFFWFDNIAGHFRGGKVNRNAPGGGAEMARE